MRGDTRHVPSRPADTGRLTRVLSPVVSAAGFDLESVRVTTAGLRRVLRMVVDADGGPSLDDIAVLSRSLSAELDSSGVMGEDAYTLEVSSPGVDRPLTEPRHWRRARGRLVRVPLTQAAPGGPGSVTGRVLEARADGVTLDVRRQAARLRLPGTGCWPSAGGVRRCGRPRRGRRARGRGGARWTLT